MRTEVPLRYYRRMSSANRIEEEQTPSQGEDRDLTSERIVALLWRRKMRQSDLSDAIGVARPNISSKLRGNRRWYLFEIVGIAEALGTSVAYLIGETDDDKPLRPEGEGEWNKWARWGSNPRPAD
ncbi:MULTISPECIES: helix-turn-helix domain-containing protein [unclassified Pseudoclavibacter]|uniref:helix-turn-helix domain-containing protein n=1 Tax=unclassified Pseudoclavibacter TaxID=2615177 RepID=UPI0035A8F2E2